MNEFKIDTSDIIAFAALILSLFTVIIEGIRSRKSLALQKQQAIDSVRPALKIEFERREHGTSYSGKVYVKNHGLGPAKITSLKCFDNCTKKEYQNTTGYVTLGTMVSQRLLENNTSIEKHPVIKHWWTQEFRNIESDQDFLAVGDEIVLLEFEIKKEEQELALFEKVFKNLQMTMEYTDMHDSQTWSIQKRLSYFQPNWTAEQLL